QHPELQIPAVNRHLRDIPPGPTSHGVPPTWRHPRQIQLRLRLLVVSSAGQTGRSGLAMAEDKGPRLPQGRIGAGPGRMAPFQDRQAGFSRAEEQRAEERSVIVSRIAKIGVTLLEDSLRLVSNQDLKRGQALVRGVVGRPVTAKVAQ